MTEVSLPSGLQSIENAAFIRCTGLTGVTAPDGIVKIGGWAFHSCAALKRVSLPAGLPILGERAFEGCRELTEIEFRVQSAQDVRYTCQDGMVRSDGGNTLVFALGGLSGPCRIPEGVRYVGEYAFARCEKITEVTVPDTSELAAKKAELTAQLMECAEARSRKSEYDRMESEIRKSPFEASENFVAYVRRWS